MKSFIIILSTFILSINLYGQTKRIPQRIFNYSLSYGPRGNSSYYSLGYEFSSNRTNANIGLGYGKCMAELNLFNPNAISINGKPDEMYVGLNYVYRNKDYRWMILVSGVGYSINGNNQLLFKAGANLQVSYPLYLSVTFYQTDKPQLMIGGRLFIF